MHAWAPLDLMRFVPAFLIAAGLLRCSAFESDNASNSVPDAAAETSGMDAADDGGAAADDGGAGASFCARARSEPNVVFCDDFDAPDRTAMSQGGWGVVPRVPGASVIPEQRCFSSPRCARIVAPTADAPHGVSVATVPFPASATELRLRLRIRAEPGDDLPAFGLALWGKANCKALFYPSSGIWFGCPGNSKISTGPIAPSSTWSLATMKVTKGPAGAVDVRVEVGEGAGAVSRSVTIPAQSTAVSETVELYVGQNEREGALEVLFDDIVVDVK